MITLRIAATIACVVGGSLCISRGEPGAAFVFGIMLGGNVTMLLNRWAQSMGGGPIV